MSIKKNLKPNRIREVREKKHVTQRELAETVGVTNQAVANWEKSLREPSPFVWVKLADKLGVSVPYLKNEDDTCEKGDNDIITEYLLNEYPQEIDKLISGADDPVLRKKIKDDQKLGELIMTEKMGHVYRTVKLALENDGIKNLDERSRNDYFQRFQKHFTESTEPMLLSLSNLVTLIVGLAIDSLDGSSVANELLSDIERKMMRYYFNKNNSD